MAETNSELHSISAGQIASRITEMEQADDFNFFALHHVQIANSLALQVELFGICKGAVTFIKANRY